MVLLRYLKADFLYSVVEIYESKFRHTSWSTNIYYFFATLAVLPRSILNNRMNFTKMIWKKKMNSSYSSKSS